MEYKRQKKTFQSESLFLGKINRIDKFLIREIDWQYDEWLMKEGLNPNPRNKKKNYKHFKPLNLTS